MHPLRPFSFLFLFLISSNPSIALDCISSNDANPNKVAFTITVDRSGHGNFTTIQKAIDSIPPDNTQWKRIQISPGRYQEKVTIPGNKPYIFLEGVDRKLTSIEWGDHDQTDTSATFSSLPENVVAKGITFKNTYNVKPKSTDLNFTQALAARIYGDKSAFYNCGFVGFQDTLWDAEGRHYFNNCYIEGAVDFIFGNGQSIFESCKIQVNVGTYLPEHAYGYITAQGRNSLDNPSGFVFKTCTISGTGKAYLGRAYGAYSRVIIYNSELSDVVEPQGWGAWHYVGHEENLEYVEAGCSGPGADTSQRVPWEKKLSATELNQFVNISYIDKEGWINKIPNLF